MELEIIRTIIADVMHLDTSDLTSSTDFEQDLDADSLEIFRILIEVERVFCRAFDLTKETLPATIQDVVELLG